MNNPVQSDDENTREGGMYVGAIAYRVLDDDKTALVLYPQIANFQLVKGEHLASTFDAEWQYPHDKLIPALKSLGEWNGEGDPEDGWVRSYPPFYRRRPNGLPEEEFVAE